VQLELPAEWITPGDVFYVRGWLVNPTSEALKDTPVCFVLQVVSDYYFWPNWTRLDPIGQTGLDYQEHDVAPGMTKVDVLPAMTWPDTGRQSLAGLMFYGAMLTPDMSALLGNLGQREWGYGPR